MALTLGLLQCALFRLVITYALLTEALDRLLSRHTKTCSRRLLSSLLIVAFEYVKVPVEDKMIARTLSVLISNKILMICRQMILNGNN